MNPAELSTLRILSKQFPSVDSALAEIARLSGELTLPRGVIHIISDIHGEDVKLRHVINNASGTLRPLIEHMFVGRLSETTLQQFVSLLFYPAETLEHLQPAMVDSSTRRKFSQETLLNLFELVRVLAHGYSVQHVTERFPAEYTEILKEIVFHTAEDRGDAFALAVIDSAIDHNRDFELIRLCVRVVRNLAVDELIIAGDLWDRGPRGDRVMEYLMHQPNVSFLWGNHDVIWLGACLGHEALIATALRISLRYRRLSQIEEGYGITLQPLTRLVQTIYQDDPASCYVPRGTGLRETVEIARMQKAAAVMQFKLEGQLIERNPEFEISHRRLLHRINHQSGTIEIDGIDYPLQDTHFPTIDPKTPMNSLPKKMHASSAFVSPS